MYYTSLNGILFVYLFHFFRIQKTLLSETAPEESRWPPELILLREKFTAKSQLEIAQLQIKHEEEVHFIRCGGNEFNCDDCFFWSLIDVPPKK